MRRHTLLVALVFFGLSDWARADDDKTFKVPFDTIKTQHIVVMIKINGKGPYRLIFDTGAPVTLINNKTAKDAGVLDKEFLIPGLPPQYKMKTVEIGELKVENLTTVVMDHPTVKAIDEVLGPVEGILGLSFFGKYRLTIDYKAKELTFVPVDFRPPDVMKNLIAMVMAGPQKKVLAPAAQWGFSVTKDVKDEDAGVVVKTVLPQSPAAKAGLMAGDRLMTLDGRWTDSVADCYLAASFVRPGMEARLLILRDGKEIELKVRVLAGL
jgi:membrane-associated protease RseP (regulator of RpoE activity)